MDAAAAPLREHAGVGPRIGVPGRGTLDTGTASLGVRARGVNPCRVKPCRGRAGRVRAAASRVSRADRAGTGGAVTARGLHLVVGSSHAACPARFSRRGTAERRSSGHRPAQRADLLAVPRRTRRAPAPRRAAAASGIADGGRARGRRARA